MNKMNKIVKDGWHPSNDPNRTTYQGDNKYVSKVASLAGRGKAESLNSQHVAKAHSHQSTPLQTLQDPSAFGPPPKNLNFYNEDGKPKSTTTGPRKYDPVNRYPKPQPRPAPRQITAGGSQRGQLQITQDGDERQQLQIAEGGEEHQLSRSGGYPAILPPRPPRRSPSPQPPQGPPPGRQYMQNPPITSRPQPTPPLPARQNSNPSEYTPAAPPAYSTTSAQVQDPSAGYLNQGAMNRLGQAGVSVPGFGIGSQKSETATTSTNTMADLGSRFAKTGLASSPASTTPSGGTTWAQKQSALQTASNFHKDPSSVSFSDARSAATTANNFRERHGAQVATGWATAQKYGGGAANKIGGMLGASSNNSLTSRFGPSPTSPTQESRSSSSHTFGQGVGGVDQVAAAAAAKKKPPPPPVKPKEFVQQQTSGIVDGPPPVPMSSRPV